MKKLSLLVLLVLFLVSMVTYGQWGSCGTYCIQYGYTVRVGDLDALNGIKTKTLKMTNGAVTNYVLTCTSTNGSAAWKPAPSGGSSCLWHTGSGGIYYSGKVGIGTTSPGSKLHVKWSASGQTYIELISAICGYNSASGNPIGILGKVNASDGKAVYGYNENPDGYGGYFEGNGYFSGDVGIGTDDPDYKLDVAGTVNMSGFKLATGAASGYVLTSNSSGVGTWQPAGGGLWSGDASTVYYNGNVGIGTTDPGDYKLAVNGTIRAKEIKVETDWSDFVFADNYKLMPLDKLENHIKANKSLPGIPTEKEVLENGIELGEMQAKFLEKIEELTLYVIELKKENEELKERISALEK